MYLHLHLCTSYYALKSEVKLHREGSARSLQGRLVQVLSVKRGLSGDLVGAAVEEWSHCTLLASYRQVGLGALFPQHLTVLCQGTAAGIKQLLWSQIEGSYYGLDNML